jgi:type IV pilus assembly protein PilX
MRNHTTRTRNFRTRARQRGAALVVGMIMLAILTLLAITAMNTSSTELVMAGNEQFRERAFQVAEVGIEQAVRDLSTVKQDGIPVKKENVKSVALPDDSYTISSRYLGEDDDIPGFSAGKFVGLHYRVDSIGSSVRNAQSTQTQGAYLLGGGGGGGPIGPLPGVSDSP